MSPFNKPFHVGGIGSSDVAAIVGLSKVRGPWQVWLEKTGQAEPEPENEAMMLGKALEATVLSLYAKTQGVEIRAGLEVQDPEHPWRRAQIDGEVVPKPIGLEAKTAGIVGYIKSGLWGEEGTDQIPQSYLCQTHYQLVLKPEWELVHVPAIVAGRGLCVFAVERHPEFESWLVEQVDRFWLDHVVPRVPPPVDASDECARYLARIHPPKENGALLEATPEIEQVVRELREKSAARKAMEADEDLLKNRLRSVIGSERGIRGNWGVVLFTKGDRNGKGRKILPKFNDEGTGEEA